ncbi:dihydropteroate synthase [Chitinimonas sp.]|uniref:dihydropteroate synthase n=1 Tax=Chitinimonas sp. TaxID=1934313 RepID=UPI0035AED79D
MKNHILRAGRFQLSLTRPLVMGIVNVTPDSFSDGGRYLRPDAALAHARRLLDEGADILDIGGESTRPGAPAVPLDEELARVMPVLRELHGWGVPISIDTRKAEVMRAALQAGVDLVNDICALSSEGALGAVANSAAAVCLMHMQGEPQSMQAAPAYTDVVAEVVGYLGSRKQAALRAGISTDRLIVDPGFGFGKAFEHNASLFRQLPALTQGDVPVLVGVSRKSMFADIIGPRPAIERDVASAAAALLAVHKGAAIVRVHAVRETVDALKTYAALA